MFEGNLTLTSDVHSVVDSYLFNQLTIAEISYNISKSLTVQYSVHTSIQNTAPNLTL